MSNVCIQHITLLKNGTNILLHMMILFIILGVVFSLFVSNIIKTSSESELKNIIQIGLGSALDKIPDNQKKMINTVTHNINLDKLIEYYDRSNTVSKTHNAWLFRTIGIISAIFVFMIIIIAITSKLTCADMDISTLLLENVFIFIGVGLAEFLFFKFVAHKYVPVTKSEIIHDLLESVKNN